MRTARSELVIGIASECYAGAEADREQCPAGANERRRFWSVSQNLNLGFCERKRNDHLGPEPATSQCLPPLLPDHVESRYLQTSSIASISRSMLVRRCRPSKSLKDDSTNICKMW